MNHEAVNKIIGHYKNGSSDDKYDIDWQIKKFTLASTPDEILYLVDGSSVELIPLVASNGSGVEVKKLENLFDHINKEHEEKAFDFFSNKLTKFSFRQDLVSCKAVYGFIYRTKEDRIIHRRAGIALHNEENKVLCTYGKIIDITDWVHPKQAFSWYASGPRATDFYAFVNDIGEFKDILTTRELEILSFIAKGYTSRQIAGTLFISKHTVDTHRRKIINKLEVKGSMQAVVKAEDIGILK